MSAFSFLTIMQIGPLFVSFGLVFLYVGIYSVRIALGHLDMNSSFPKSLKMTFVVFVLGAPLLFILIYYIRVGDSFGFSFLWGDLLGWVVGVLVVGSFLFIGVVFPFWIVWQALLWLRMKLRDTGMQARSV